MFNFGLQADAWKPKENDAGVSESLRQDQRTEIVVVSGEVEECSPDERSLTLSGANAGTDTSRKWQCGATSTRSEGHVQS